MHINYGISLLCIIHHGSLCFSARKKKQHVNCEYLYSSCFGLVWPQLQNSLWWSSAVGILVTIIVILYDLMARSWQTDWVFGSFVHRYIWILHRPSTHFPTHLILPFLLFLPLIPPLSLLGVAETGVAV